MTDVKLCYFAVLGSLSLCAKNSSGSFKIISIKCVYNSYIFDIYV